jgi:hypothetical protein
MAGDTQDTDEPSISGTHTDFHSYKLPIYTRMYQNYIIYILAYVHT